MIQRWSGAGRRRLYGGVERREEGQATVEYALVVLAAAAIALLVIAWAARTGKIGQLFDLVFDRVLAGAG